MVEFTVLTYNAGNWRAKPDRLVAALESMNADLIGLQELSHAQAEAIAGGLAAAYPHQAMFPGGFAGKAVLSRFPILRSEQLYLGPERPDLLCEIDMGIEPLTLIAAHPPPPIVRLKGFGFHPATWAQIQALVALAVEKSPSILLGDFNLIDQQQEYRYLQSAGLGDAFLEAGSGPGKTLPRRLGPWKRFTTFHRLISWLPLLPMLRVDYIWHTASLRALQAWVGADAGSDHLPVLAKFAM